MSLKRHLKLLSQVVVPYLITKENYHSVQDNLVLSTIPNFHIQVNLAPWGQWKVIDVEMQL